MPGRLGKEFHARSLGEVSLCLNTVLQPASFASFCWFGHFPRVLQKRSGASSVLEGMEGEGEDHNPRAQCSAHWAPLGMTYANVSCCLFM